MIIIIINLNAPKQPLLQSSPASNAGSSVGRQTRLLVTNSAAYLPQMDFIIVLRHGEISEMGSFEELLGHHGAFADFIDTYLREAEHEDDEGKEGEREDDGLAESESGKLIIRFDSILFYFIW